MATLYPKEKGVKIEIIIKDENGTVIDLTVCTVRYLVKKTDNATSGSSVELTPYVDSETGKLGVSSYTTTSVTDFNNAAGTYYIQPKVTLQNGSVFYGTTVSFEISEYYK